MEQKPIIEGLKDPDYRIDGEVFDNYAPKTDRLRNIRGVIKEKIENNQARNIILNLHDTSATVMEIDNYLLLYPVDGLDKLWFVDRWGEIHYLRGGKR